MSGKPLYAGKDAHEAIIAETIVVACATASQGEAAELQAALDGVNAVLTKYRNGISLAVAANILAHHALGFRGHSAVELARSDLAVGYGRGIGEVLFRMLSNVDGVPAAVVEREIETGVSDG